MEKLTLEYLEQCVYSLNEILYNNLGDAEELEFLRFEVYSCGYTRGVSFVDIPIWDTEENSLNNDGDCENINLEYLLAERALKYGKAIVKGILLKDNTEEDGDKC